MMKVASLIMGILILCGFKITTDWNSPALEFALNVVVFICATALILVPIIITYLEARP